MFLPYRMDLGTDREYQAQASRVVDELRAWGASAGYPVLDLRDALPRDIPRDYFLDAMHFSPEGHQLVARATKDWLMGAGLAPQPAETR
jgi:lysophospholipase L1-like esterase